MALQGVKLAFVGAGQMACHIIQPIIRNGIVRASDIVATQPSKHHASLVQDQFPGIRVSTNNQEAIEDADMVFVGVKPVDFMDVAKEVGFKHPQGYCWELADGSSAQERSSQTRVACGVHHGCSAHADPAERAAARAHLQVHAQHAR